MDDVLITAELSRRRHREPDYAAESRALGALAQEMTSGQPERVLQAVAEWAMQLCRADSAGISVLEPGGQNGIFRWHAATGAFAPNLHGTMPRDASPCSTVIGRNEVLLFNEGERFFPALRGVEPRIYENLLAPWTVNGEPVGTVWVIQHTPDRDFDAEDARLLASLARFASAAHQMGTALQSAQTAQQELERKVEERTKDLRESGEQFRTVVESARDYAIFTTDPEGTVLDWYGGAEMVFGYAAPEIKGRPTDILFTPEDRAAGEAAKELQQARAEGSAPDVRWHMRKDGRRVFIDGHTAALRDAEGRLTGFLKIGQDVTERKRFEAALRKSDERQAFLLKLSDALRAEPNAQAVADRAIKMLIEQMQLDRSYIESYGIGDDQANLVHQVGNETVPPLPDGFILSHYPAAFRASFDQTFVIEDEFERQGLSDAEGRASGKLGMRAMVAATVRKGKDYPLWSMVAISSHPRRWTRGEIALVEETAERTWAAVERARAEAALCESEQNLHGVANIVPDLLWYSEPDGWTPWYNHRWVEYTGQTSEQAIGWGWVDAIHPDDRAGSARRYRDAVEKCKPLQQEHRIRRHDGEYRWSWCAPSRCKTSRDGSRACTAQRPTFTTSEWRSKRCVSPRSACRRRWRLRRSGCCSSAWTATSTRPTRRSCA